MKPKCPKCRSKQVEIIEYWSGTSISWEPDAAADEGIMDGTGDPYKVVGKCRNCKHSWTFRGIVQVKDDWWK